MVTAKVEYSSHFLLTHYWLLTLTGTITLSGGDVHMGANGGRNLRGVEGNPAEEGLYLRTNVSFPPSLLKRLDTYCNQEERARSWVIQKAVDEWLKKKGY